MTLKESIKKNIVKTEYEDDNHFENLFFLFDKYLYESNPKNMIDVGCANGDRTVRIAKYFNINLQDTFGVDYNGKNIATCKDLFNAKIIDLETENLPYKSNSFDIVVCNQVLEHLKNYKKVIEELIRITCNKGYIAIGIPNLAHLINRLYLIFGIQPLCLTLNSSHVRGFTHKAFLKMIEIYDEVALVDCRGALM
jgi:ubiquinone/menaquinone biosynthesis C-methylase UbiE